MSGRSAAACQTLGCTGVLGAWVGDEFLLASHLVGGRDAYLLANGALRLRCSRCNTWHRIVVRPDRPGHPRLVVAPPPGDVIR